jgi:hypothetical protein
MRAGATGGHEFYVKEGPLKANWVKELDGVGAFPLDGNRIGALGKDGQFYVKEGPLNANWVKEADSVSAFQLGSSASKASSVGK